MNTTLRRDVLTETYIDVKNLILKTAWRFHKRYGGELQELIGEANWLYVDAFDKYDESRNVKFTAYLSFHIWNGLKDAPRQQYLPTLNEAAFEKMAPTSYPLSELLEELNQDELVMIQLLFDTPKEMLELVNPRGSSLCHLKPALRKHLSNIGWTGNRIKGTIKEIRNALYG